jgi:ADP-dependent NAD(P)H-hydrate dehydratase / NAD(P)H-hydrate epimerase
VAALSCNLIIMRILTCEEVRAVERESVSRMNISTLLLMEQAGQAVFQFCLSHYKFGTVCAVCGKGNNGGDGMVAAELLRAVASQVSVVILARDTSELSADAAVMCSRLNAEPIWISNDADFETDAVRRALGADLILDAVVGTGFKPPLRGLAARAVIAINEARGAVVAVDLPSGIDADRRLPIRQNHKEVVSSEGIATFIAPKPAHVFGELTSGAIAVSELGTQATQVTGESQLQVVTGKEVGITFPPRASDANKGQFGHILVIAGSRGKAGAAALAGLAALRTGAGVVTVACAQSTQPTVAGFAPELMTEALPETGEGTVSEAAAEKVDALLAGKDVVVVGPGLSRNHETAIFIRKLVAHCRLPLVLDADGLNAFEGLHDELKAGGNFRVLTPHPGEAARLMGTSIKQIQEQRLESARRIADETGSCVVLKGSRTVIAGLSGETWINMTGNPAMAKGGSGDVLSGIIAAALGRRATGPGEEAKSAVSLNDLRVASAVHLHGLAGDFARDILHENTVLATDLLDNLSEAFLDCELQRERGLYYLQK